MWGQLSRNELELALKSNCTTAGLSVLSNSHETEARDVLAEAFLEDPLFVWVAGLEDNDPSRVKKMTLLGQAMHGWIDCNIFHGGRGVPMGIMGRDNEIVGCMMVVPSSTHKEGIVGFVRALYRVGPGPMYKSETKGNYCANSSKRLEQLGILAKKRAAHMKGVKKWIYLQTIGVRKNEQGKGRGKAMLELLNRTANSLEVPLYLETESKENESLYKHFGYQTLEELDLCVPGDTDHVRMYLMRRDP